MEERNQLRFLTKKDEEEREREPDLDAKASCKTHLILRRIVINLDSHKTSIGK